MVLQRGRYAPPDVQLMHQISWRVDSYETLQGCHRRLVEHDIRIQQIVTHGNAFGIYFFDPEGNRNEQLRRRDPSRAHPRPACLHPRLGPDPWRGHEVSRCTWADARDSSGLITTIGGNSSPLLGRMFPQPLVLDESGRIVPLDSVLGDGYCVLLIDPLNREVDSRLVSLAATVAGTVRSLLLADRLPWRASESYSVMDSGFLAEFAHLKEKTLLVRPDRYVAAIFDPESAPEIERWARGTLVLNAATR